MGAPESLAPPSPPLSLEERGIGSFFYKTERPQVGSDEFGWLVKRVDSWVLEHGLGGASNIEALAVRPENFAEIESFNKIKRECNWPDEIVGADLVFCSWASLHNDPSWVGEAFVSLVISTGSSGYTVSTHRIDYGQANGVPVVTSQAYLMQQGDMFVLDPSVPHSATPSFPADDSLLVLLQTTHPLRTEGDRLEILLRHPPAENLRQDGF